MCALPAVGVWMMSTSKPSARSRGARCSAICASLPGGLLVLTWTSSRRRVTTSLSCACAALGAKKNDTTRTAITRRMRQGLPSASCCNRVVIDGHNDVLTHLHENGAADDALLTEGSATITVPSARAGGLAAGLFAVLPPVEGDWIERSPGGWDVPYHPSVAWEEAARTVGALGARLQRLLR